jgi:hypothetical protein
MPHRLVSLSDRAREALAAELSSVQMDGDASVSDLDHTPDTADQYVARLIARATAAVERSTHVMSNDERQFVMTVWSEMTRSAGALEAIRSLIREAKAAHGFAQGRNDQASAPLAKKPRFEPTGG